MASNGPSMDSDWHCEPSAAPRRLKHRTYLRSGFLALRMMYTNRISDVIATADEQGPGQQVQTGDGRESVRWRSLYARTERLESEQMADSDRPPSLASLASLAPRVTEGILAETLRTGLPSGAASEASDWRRMAERVGFEPTCRFWRQDAFEAPPLRPLRYLSAVTSLTTCRVGRRADAAPDGQGHGRRRRTDRRRQPLLDCGPRRYARLLALHHQAVGDVVLVDVARRIGRSRGRSAPTRPARHYRTRRSD